MFLWHDLTLIEVEVKVEEENCNLNKGLNNQCNFPFKRVQAQGGNAKDKNNKGRHFGQTSYEKECLNHLCVCKKNLKPQERFKTSSRDDITIGVLPLERNNIQAQILTGY